MIQKKPSAWNRSRLKNMIIAAGILLVLIATTIITNLVVGFIGGQEEEESTLPVVDTALGESIYAGRPIAYKKFSSEQIQAVKVSYYEEVKNGDPVLKSYSAIRPSETDEFEFVYTDTNNVTKVYRPEMYYQDGTSYTDFYATENDGYNIYRLSYLLVAVSVLYFGEKMALPTATTDRDNMLDRYGLSMEERQSIYVEYINEKREVVKHLIHIGNKTIDGLGYYFTVSSPALNEIGDEIVDENGTTVFKMRDYIYCSSTTGFDYALNGFVSFLHSRLTAQGLAGDSSMEPYFTQNYQQWKNVIHENGPNNTCNPLENTCNHKTSWGNKVIVSGAEEEYIYMDYSDIFGTDLKYEKSGRYFQEGQFTVNLDKTANQKKLINVLLNKPDGEFDESVQVTLEGDTNWVMMDARYVYTIKAIEAILTENGADITTEGVAVGDARFIKVVYDYEYEYAPVKNPEHYQTDKDVKGVIDLSMIDEDNIPESLKKMFGTLKELKIGNLADQNLSVEQKQNVEGVIVDYTEETAYGYDVQYVITDIDVIYATDKDGWPTDQITKIDENSIVNFRYKLMHGTEVLSTGKNTVALASITDESGLNSKIKEALIGKELGEQSISVNDSVYREWISDFRTYTIDKIEYFIEQELVVSFEFVNASKRDPFYAESLFKNTLTNQNKIYALDSTATEYVVRLLGGISIDSNSSTSEGLKGLETVAVGLTPQNMLEKGLYANTIYYEIPRGIVPDLSVDGDYAFNNTLGFTLYISDVQSDGTRYVGSDMYDIIAKVDGSDFVFLDKNFVDYWAREAMAAVSYDEIYSMDVNFNMSDLKGSYTFKVNHHNKWIYGDKLLNYEPEGGGQAYDQIRIVTTVHNFNTATDSIYKQLVRERHKTDDLTEEELNKKNLSYSLTQVYKAAMGTEGEPMYNNDTYDGMNFKTLLSVIFNTYYTGTISATEQVAIKEMIEDKTLQPIMKMSFKIGKSGEEWYADTYEYTFYKIDDRRIMVKINTVGKEAEAVSDFYISPLAFKKIANGFVALLNGRNVVEDEGFADR